ncbi:mediator of DNA damage checkpoint protein 1 isoform X2 [Hemiscyllium ocellatum]|uniref:mediator of DNA damage checkpoint protein 1 isoform X2 n=1 Tax=Hemiscyllium ocellatum TaxID=170820 RepID=UPI002967375F|nr:mediator of DNA damage checkpoint protein 1 isoform X2 [Hemiscyllium ocellatum]
MVAECLSVPGPWIPALSTICAEFARSPCLHGFLWVLRFPPTIQRCAGFLLYQGENIIGRHESCHVHIPVSSVSKRHAVIEIDGDSHLIYDCNSLNKTRRKNVVLKPDIRYAINDGDLFLFADVACQYVLLSPPAAPAGDSGSETDSESLFPHAKPGSGDQQLDDNDAAGDNLESAEDSLMVSPTQPYYTKSVVIALQSDTYVKDSEDDDTPWKCSAPFTARDGQHQSALARQTPSAHVVPESDEEEGESSHSNLQSKQLHYDSETDLEEDQEPGEKWTERCAERLVDGSHVNSEMAGIEEQQADDTPPLTNIAVSDCLKTVQEMDVPEEALDRDAGRTSTWESGAPPAANHLPHFSRDSDDEEEDSLLTSNALLPGTKTDSNLTEGVGLQVAEASTCDRGLIHPGTREESSHVDLSADHDTNSTGDAKETASGVNEREPPEEHSDTDIDDDIESYTLEATQCFTLNVSVSQDEAAKENNHTPDAGITAGANTEEKPTQLVTCQSPTFNKEPFNDNTAATSNTEEDVTQPFTFRSPTFGNTAAASKTEEEATQLFTFPSPAPCEETSKNSSVTVGNTEEEATQPFTFQSPTFSKDISKGTAVALSDTEEEATQPFTADAAIQRPVISSPHSERSEGIPEDDQWAEGETQSFFFQNQVTELDRSGEAEESEGTVPIIPAVDSPAPTVQDLATSPPGTKRQSLLEVGSCMGPQATPEQLQSPEAGKGGHRQQTNEERSSMALGEQQLAEASEDVGKRETSGREQAATPDTEECSNSSLNLAPAPAPTLPSSQRETETGAGAEAENSAVPRDQQQNQGSIKPRDCQQHQHRKDPELGSQEVSLPLDRAQVGPRRGRGRPRSISASTTDKCQGPPEEGEEHSQAPVVRGRRAKQSSLAALDQQARNVEETPRTDGASQQQPAGRGRRRAGSALGQAGNMEETAQTDGASQQQPVGRGRRRAGASPAKLAENVEETAQTDGASQQQPAGRGRRRAGASPAKLAHSVEETAQTDGASQQQPAGRGRRRAGTSPAKLAENVEETAQTDGASQQQPAGRGRRRAGASPAKLAHSVEETAQTDGASQQQPAGRGRRRAGTSPAKLAENMEETAQTDGASQQQPAGRGRRRAGTSPAKLAENVEETAQTDSASQQQPAGRGRRRAGSALGHSESVEETAQTEGISQQQPAGRGRRRSVAAPIQSENVLDTSQTDGAPQQHPAGRGRRRAGTSQTKLAENVEETTQTDGASQQRPARGRRRSVAAPIQGESTLDTSQTDGSSQERPAGRGRRQARGEATIPAVNVGDLSQPNGSLQQGLTGRGKRKQECAQPSLQETGLTSGRKRRVRGASPSEIEKESSTPPQVKTRRTAGRLSSGSLLDTVPSPKVMFTGLVDENGVKVIKQLGGEVVESVHDSTHLVTDRIRRTVKFLCAVARGIPVVTPEWLVKSGKSNCFLSTSGFLVDDSDQEKKFNFKLAESLQKAKEQPLLQDYRVHVTSGVLPEPSQMESIIQCSGATVLPKMPRVYKAKTLVISCPDDLPKCKPAWDAKVPIVNAEFILTGTLQQVVDLVSYRLDQDVTDQPEGKARKRSLAAAQTTDNRKKKR